MAGKSNLGDNLIYGNNPFDWSHGGGIEQKLSAHLDPLNLTGWNDKDPYQVDWNGQPLYPDYNSPYDEKTMSMGGELQRRLDGNNLDKEGMNKFKDEAFRVGPSKYAKLAGGQQDMMAVDARNRVNRSAAGSAAQARTQLAMRGGLGGGAAERIATGSARNVMDLSQNVSRQNAENHGQIAMNDEQNRIQQLGMVPGMDLNAANFDLSKTKMWGEGFQYDTTNKINANKYLNDWNMDKYKQQGAQWAAGQQANATSSAGGGKK